MALLFSAFFLAILILFSPVVAVPSEKKLQHPEVIDGTSIGSGKGQQDIQDHSNSTSFGFNSTIHSNKVSDTEPYPPTRSALVENPTPSIDPLCAPLPGGHTHESDKPHKVLESDIERPSGEGRGQGGYESTIVTESSQWRSAEILGAIGIIVSILLAIISIHISWRARAKPPPKATHSTPDLGSG